MMRTKAKLALIVAALTVAGCASSSPLSGRRYGEAIMICRSAPIPVGWVWVDDAPGDQSCPSTDSPFPKITIKNLNGAAYGVAEWVCLGAILPRGWIRVSQSRDMGLCSTVRSPRFNRELIKYVGDDGNPMH
jgi:hypothetical protein